MYDRVCFLRIKECQHKQMTQGTILEMSHEDVYDCINYVHVNKPTQQCGVCKTSL